MRFVIKLFTIGLLALRAIHLHVRINSSSRSNLVQRVEKSVSQAAVTISKKPITSFATEETPAGLSNFFSSAFYGYTSALIMHMLNIKRGPRVSV